MEKIACAGYHGTGAGVIDDLLREFDNIAQGAYECESRYLHDADGISDLEYNLVENPHRLNSGYAIRRFLAYAKMNNRQLSKVYGSYWLTLAKKYANSITKFEYSGHKGHETSLYSCWEHKLAFIKKVFNKLKPQKYRNPAWHDYYPGHTTLHSKLSEAEFLEKTRIFVDELCEKIPHKSDDEFVVIDQMFPGNNIERYLRYVNNVKVIIVDRDPRDLYIRQRSLPDHVLPNDPYQFCEYYRDIRPKPGFVAPSNVLYVSFEDMIFKYDEMVKKVLNFLEIDPIHHISPRSHFDPSVSIRGTKTWLKYPEYAKEIEIIEKELSDYLYNYES